MRDVGLGVAAAFAAFPVRVEFERVLREGGEQIVARKRWRRDSAYAGAIGVARPRGPVGEYADAADGGDWGYGTGGGFGGGGGGGSGADTWSRGWRGRDGRVLFHAVALGTAFADADVGAVG